MQTQTRPSSFVVVLEFDSSVDSSIGTERVAALNVELPPGAHVGDLLTDSISPSTGEEETRLTRFTPVAVGPGDFIEAIAIGVIRAEDSSLDVLGFTDKVEVELTSAA